MITTCTLATYLIIIGSTDPCGVQERYINKFNEAQSRLELAEWLMTCPEGCPNKEQYKPRQAKDTQTIVIERPGPWVTPEGYTVIGVYKIPRVFGPTTHTIEYSLPDERVYDTLAHEIGHMLRYLQYSWDNHGWVNIGHGNIFDVYFQSVDWLQRWMYPLAPGHSYLPRLLPAGNPHMIPVMEAGLVTGCYMLAK